MSQQSKIYVRNYSSGSNVPGYYGEENATYVLNASSFGIVEFSSLQARWTVEVTGVDELKVHAGSFNYMGQGQLYWWPGTKFLRGTSSHPLYQHNNGIINMNSDMYYAETNVNSSITVYVQYNGVNSMQIRNITTEIAGLTPEHAQNLLSNGLSDGTFSVVQETSASKLYVRNYSSGSNVPGYYGEENSTYVVNAGSYSSMGNESLAATWTVEVTGVDEVTIHAGSLNYMGQGQIYWWPGTKFLRGTSSHPLHQDNGGGINMHPDMYYAETNSNSSLTVYVQNNGVNSMQIHNITTSIAALTPEGAVPGEWTDGLSDGTFSVVQGSAVGDPFIIPIF